MPATRKFKKIIMVISGISLLLAGVFVSRLFKKPPLFHSSEYIMGTIFDITASGNDERLLERTSKEAFEEIKRIDNLMSRYKEGSQVSLVNINAGIAPIRVGSELIEVLQEAIKISELSGGVFDVTIGPLTDLWGFDSEKNIIPPKDKIEKLRDLVNYKKLKIDEAASTVYLEDKGMMIDVGGIAKGYSLTRAMKVFENAGIRNFIINAGGNLILRGVKNGNPWKIGIQNPRDESKLLGKVAITDISVATSGDYQRYFMKDGIRYHHILDPKTGFPAKGLISATIIGNGKTSMDGYSSAVFILGAEKGGSLMKKIGAEGIMVTEDGRTIVTDGLKGKLLADP